MLVSTAYVFLLLCLQKWPTMLKNSTTNSWCNLYWQAYHYTLTLYMHRKTMFSQTRWNVHLETPWPVELEYITDFGLLEQDRRLCVPPRGGFVNIYLFLVNSEFLGALNPSNKETTLLLLAWVTFEVVSLIWLDSHSSVVSWSSNELSGSTSASSRSRTSLPVAVLALALALPFSSEHWTLVVMSCSHAY